MEDIAKTDIQLCVCYTFLSGGSE